MAKGTFIQRSRSVSPIQKATGHQITGVGRSKIKRKFFGLDKDDETAILKKITDFLAKSLRSPR